LNLSNIELVFVAYSESRIVKNKAKLVSCFEFLLSLGLERIIIVNNASNLELTEFQGSNFDNKIEVIRGSNLHAEFSGWIEGITHSAGYQTHSQSPKTSYILMNDTVFSHYPVHLNDLLQFTHVLAQQEISRPCTVGTLHKRNSMSYTVMDLQLTDFIATAFFYINAPAAQIFEKQCRKVFDFFDDLNMNNMSSFELLSKFYNEAGAYYIGNWLFAGGWYGSTNYEQFNKTLLKLKLAAIVCEHSTSASVLSHGGKLIDFKQTSRKKGNLSLLRNLTLSQGFKLLKFKKSFNK
jgi:hypothetical protein